jgi:DNA-binding NtrC family response regulator
VKRRLLFVEDDDTLRFVLARELRGMEYDVASFAAPAAALEALDDERLDVALLDLRLPGMSGIELMGELLRRLPGLPVILLTGNGTLREAVAAMREGAFDFLVKPAPLDELELTLRRAVEHGELLRQNHLLRGLAYRGTTAEILGESPVMLELRNAIPRIAASDAGVLIYGESGTGKELVARAIHDHSPRRAAAFVVVNCGAIPAQLFESELFGHRRGAFTGADRRRLGLIELAEGGTLFLDEIGELPLELQPALLRAVQFGEFRPVGAERSERADVRFLAATHRDLETEVRAGGFREDLYHRISTLGLRVPPLRERSGDVRLLAERLLARYNEKVAEPFAKRFVESGLRRLESHAWSGNVRELENIIVRLVTLVEARELGAEDVERHLRPLARRAGGELFTLDLDTLERAAIVQALRRAQGHRAKAAAELGVAVKTLYNKILQHQISELEWR